jgi:hypothetical protein
VVHLAGRQSACAFGADVTGDDWTKVEAELRSPYGSVTLQVDGYEVVLQVRQLKPLKFAIHVYVGGWWKGEWNMKDCEERRRFCQCRTASMYSPAKKAELIKSLGKRAAAKYFRLDEKFTWYTAVWSTFGPLKRHLVANNTLIALKGTGL